MVKFLRGAISTLKKSSTAIAMGTTLAVGSGLALYSDKQVAFADDVQIHPQEWPFPNQGLLSTWDAASLRRGYQVYREVCSTCHSMKYMAFRHMHHFYAKDEMNSLCEDLEIKITGDDGEPSTRPAIPSDYFPPPYDNDQQAASANGGRIPPDLTNIVKAREGGRDYVFSLLTGYCDPPVGSSADDGTYFNPYFLGNAIGMAPPLNNDHQIEYHDGTEASLSQMAKDVTHFLDFAAAPSDQNSKQFGLKAMIGVGILAALMGVAKRNRWSSIKNRTYKYKDH